MKTAGWPDSRTRFGVKREVLRRRQQETLVVIEDVGQLRGPENTGSLKTAWYQVLFAEEETMTFQE